MGLDNDANKKLRSNDGIDLQAGTVATMDEIMVLMEICTTMLNGTIMEFTANL